MGHCGTQWLSAFLNRPDDGMVCTHEEKSRVAPYHGMPDGWLTSLQREKAEGLQHTSDVYVAQMKQRQQEFAIVGDAHSWEPFVIPELAHMLPVSRIIFLVRNGVQNVHSMYYHNAHIFKRGSWFYTDYLATFADLLGFRDLDDFGLWCAWWGANVASARSLEQVAPVTTVCLEDLTRHPMRLIELTKSLQGLAQPTVMEARDHAGIDINRKIHSRRDPDFLWSTWTDHQRATFIRVCGDTMHHLGYAVPCSA
jgi:hypothetical protein